MHGYITKPWMHHSSNPVPNPAANKPNTNKNLLSVPFVRTAFGARSFSIAAPKMWNSLPPALRIYTSPRRFVVISSTPTNPLNAFLLAPQIRLLLTIVRVYKLYYKNKTGISFS